MFKITKLEKMTCQANVETEISLIKVHKVIEAEVQWE